MIILLVAFYALQRRQHYRPQRETSLHTMRVLHAGCARLREGTRLDARASVMRSDDNSLTLSTRAAGYLEVPDKQARQETSHAIAFAASNHTRWFRGGVCADS
jgi:hypothetical protein